MKRKSRALSFVVFLFGAFALTGLASTLLWLRRPGEDRPDTPDFLYAVAVACLATLVNLSTRWLRWHFLLRTFAVRLRARESLAVFSSLLPMVFTPWAAGEILLFPMLRRHAPRPLLCATLVWLLSRAADAGALLLLASMWSAWLLLPSLLCFAVAVLSMASLERRGGRAPRLARFLLFFLLSVVAWSIAATGLFGVVRLLGGPTGLAECVRIFSAGTLSGSLFGVPGGIVFTGGTMIRHLLETGLPENMAIWSVLAVRAGTVGFTALVGVGALIRFRNTLLGLVRGSMAAGISWLDAGGRTARLLVSEWRWPSLLAAAGFLHASLRLRGPWLALTLAAALQALLLVAYRIPDIADYLLPLSGLAALWLAAGLHALSRSLCVRPAARRWLPAAALAWVAGASALAAPRGSADDWRRDAIAEAGRVRGFMESARLPTYLVCPDWGRVSLARYHLFAGPETPPVRVMAWTRSEIEALTPQARRDWIRHKLPLFHDVVFDTVPGHPLLDLRPPLEAAGVRFESRDNSYFSVSGVAEEDP